MSHLGPTFAEQAIVEQRRKAQNTTAVELLVAIEKAVKEARPEPYRGTQDFVNVSPESHAERLRKAILTQIESTAYYLNVTKD